MRAESLIDIAKKARERAYSPYSGFSVGAALLCADGSVYEGCNIENASYSPTCCAERVAIFKAVSEGRGKGDFVGMAIVGARRGEEPSKPCYPCGVCRQVISEFCDKDMVVYFADGTQTTLAQLLPYAFELSDK